MYAVCNYTYRNKNFDFSTRPNVGYPLLIVDSGHLIFSLIALPPNWPNYPLGIRRLKSVELDDLLNDENSLQKQFMWKFFCIYIIILWSCTCCLCCFGSLFKIFSKLIFVLNFSKKYCVSAFKVRNFESWLLPPFIRQCFFWLM